MSSCKNQRIQPKSPLLQYLWLADITYSDSRAKYLPHNFQTTLGVGRSKKFSLIIFLIQNQNNKKHPRRDVFGQFISRILSWATIYLGHQLLSGSSDTPPRAKREGVRSCTQQGFSRFTSAFSSLWQS